METEHLAPQFINECAPQFHGMFAAPAYFNMSASTYEVPDITDLRETIEHIKHQDATLDDLELNLNTCTWQDVHDELEDARNAALESENRGKKFFTRVWRGIGRTVDVVAPGLDAIPDDIRVLRAALSVAFCLARHRHQVRQKILAAFETIPDIVQTAEANSRILVQEGRYVECEELKRHIETLRTVIVQTIPNLIEHLNPGTFFRKATSPFKGFGIDDLINAVRIQAEKVRVHAEIVETKMISSIDQTTRDTSGQVTGMNQIIHEGFDEIRQFMEKLLEESKLMRYSFECVSGKQHLLHFLRDQQKPRGSVSSLSVADAAMTRATSTSPDHPSTSISSADLLDLLHVCHFKMADDIDAVHRYGRSADKAELASAALMAQYAQFRQLLDAAASGIVLVEGCGDRSQAARVSPLSVVCSTLAQSLCLKPARVSLLFFCGRHVSVDDEMGGPGGLVRCLLFQLVNVLVREGWLPDEAEFCVSQTDVQLHQLSLQQVCELLHQFVRFVPAKVEVFCLVDGISFFEGEHWILDYELVIQTLSNIIQDESLESLFKLIMTTPTRSCQLSDLQAHQRIHLRGGRGHRCFPTVLGS